MTAASPWLAWRRGDDLASMRRRLRAAHEDFLTRTPESALDEDPSRAAVRPVVLESWQRAAMAGVDPDHAAMDVIGDLALRELRLAHPLRSVLPVIQRLLVEDAADAGMLVALTDATGRLLWVEGDQTLRRKAAGMGFVEGADWSESTAGTNAPGTAIALDHSVQIFAAEHFNRLVQPWSCSAAPVHDPDTGRLLGALDVTGGDRVAAPEMLSLVRATVAAVEAELRLQRMRDGHRSAPALASNARRFRLRPMTAAPRLRVLGRDRAVLDNGREVGLGLRHAELLLIMLGHPSGLSAEQLAIELDERELDPVTVRAEVTRLRQAVGPELVLSRPYRVAGKMTTDIDDLRASLADRAVDRATQQYLGPVLPRSAAPYVVSLRAELQTELRAAVLGSRDPALLLDWVRSEHGRDDVDVWRACAAALPPGHPERTRCIAHVHLLDDRRRATWMQRRPT